MKIDIGKRWILLHATITGHGRYLPPWAATNANIGAFLPQSEDGRWTPDWVERKLGIMERRSAFDFDTGSLRDQSHYDLDNAERAAQEALESAGVRPADIDRVIWATTTPEFPLPDPACLLHQRLGMRRSASAVGLAAVGCGGFIYGLDIADSDIRAGKSKRVLVVGSVVISPYLAAIHASDNAAERELHLKLNAPNAYIFGEGAGAMVLEATTEEKGVLHSFTGACGDDNPVWFRAGGSRQPATHETVSRGLHRFDMDSAIVKRFGPRLFQEAVTGGLGQTEWALRDFDRFIFHQVNPRALAGIVKTLGVDPDKTESHAVVYGNLDTATLPIAFAEARSAGRIKPGDLVLFAAIGAGWQFGAAIVRV